MLVKIPNIPGDVTNLAGFLWNCWWAKAEDRQDVGIPRQKQGDTTGACLPL
jgi:hypothetical protein